MNPLQNRGLTAVLPLNNKEQSDTSKEVDTQNGGYVVFEFSITLFMLTFCVGIYRPK